ncbi:MAG: RMD1 family protein [Alphaproteobacteria bacterium]|nr:RMD1 family protein [Alphaproteobacteria bacterium]
MTIRARAVLLGDRLSPDRAAQARVISTAPFAFRKGEGFVVAFRYGAAVLIGLDPAEEDETLALLAGPPAGAREEERIGLELGSGQDEGLNAAGVLQLRELTQAHVLVLADILGKSVALAHYEKEIASVLDAIEPAAGALAATGRIPSARTEILKLVGSALLTQHRVSGRIAFAEKPDILWEHPELERFYARLEDEYEIVERGSLLNGKMSVIASAAETFTDMMDTARSARLELLIVILILAELVIAAATLFHPW